MGSQNIRLLIEYDGSEFAGWQTQEGLPTIQGALCDALRSVTGEVDATVGAAGRTDAGVHAFGQVANFFTEHPMEGRRFAPGLNFYLPPTIRVHRSEAVSSSFDARRDSTSKRYRYRIYEGPHPPALHRRRAWHVRRRHVDVAAMRLAAEHLLGEQDFETFRSTQCDAAHAVRTIHTIDITAAPHLPVGQMIDIVFHANAFCRHMCRILAGSLLEVGIGKRQPADIQAMLLARDRRRAGVTAPPWGLTLLEVLYAERARRLSKSADPSKPQPSA